MKCRLLVAGCQLLVVQIDNKKPACGGLCGFLATLDFAAGPVFDHGPDDAAWAVYLLRLIERVQRH
jgi:hypothetical protein